MNGSKARAIRKMVYGDLSIRDPKYGLIRHIKGILGKDPKTGKEIVLASGQVVCTGKRLEYKRAKKAFREGRLCLL